MGYLWDTYGPADHLPRLSLGGLGLAPLSRPLHHRTISVPMITSCSTNCACDACFCRRCSFAYSSKSSKFTAAGRGGTSFAVWPGVVEEADAVRVNTGSRGLLLPINGRGRDGVRHKVVGGARGRREDRHLSGSRFCKPLPPMTAGNQVVVGSTSSVQSAHSETRVRGRAGRSPGVVHFRQVARRLRCNSTSIGRKEESVTSTRVPCD